MATKNITSDYQSHDKAELQAEVELRGIEDHVTGTGANGAVVKDDLVNALTLDDEASGSDPREQTEKGLSHAEHAKSDGMTTREVPEDLDEYKGRYRYLATGEIFGLKVKDDSEVFSHKTHHAKNALKFWDGTAAEFRNLFDKV